MLLDFDGRSYTLCTLLPIVEDGEEKKKRDKRKIRWERRMRSAHRGIPSAGRDVLFIRL